MNTRPWIVFLDESGVSLLPQIRRTYASRGRTPLLRHRLNWKRASMAAALGHHSTDPDRRARLYFNLKPGSYDTAGLIWFRIKQRSPWAVCEDSSMDEEVMPILRVEDAAAAVAWYERLGFAKQWEHRFEPGLPAFVEVARGGVRLFLSEHEADARPDTLVYLRIRDVEAIASEFGVQAKDAPWAREVELRDPDGNRLRIGTPTE